MNAAQESARRAELGGCAKATRGHRIARRSHEGLHGSDPRPSRVPPSCHASRSVSNEPGSRLLIVTPWRATLRARPAAKPVSPLRAPFDSAEHVDRRLHGRRRDVDDPPESARDHPDRPSPDQLDRRQHVGVERADPCVAVDSRENRRAAAPPALLTRMSGCGHAASAGAPSARRDVAGHPRDRTADTTRRSPSAVHRTSSGCARRSSRRRRRRPAPPRSRVPGPCWRHRPGRCVRRCRDPSESFPTTRRRAATARRTFTTVPIAKTSSAAMTKNISRREPMVEHQAEPDRTEHRAKVETRVHETVYASGSAFRRGVAHDQVARRARRAQHECRSDEHRDDAAAASPAPLATSASSAAPPKQSRRRRPGRDASFARRGTRRQRYRPVPPSRYAVTADVASTSGTASPALSADRQECLQTDRLPSSGA